MVRGTTLAQNQKTGLGAEQLLPECSQAGLSWVKPADSGDGGGRGLHMKPSRTPYSPIESQDGTAASLPSFTASLPVTVSLSALPLCLRCLQLCIALSK